MADEGTDLSSVFNDTLLRVPAYQRSYSWRDQQVEDFHDDLDYVIEKHLTEGKTDYDHFFGMVILNTLNETEGDYDVYDLSDGQQRLTTTVIAAAVINNEIERVLSEDVVTNSKKRDSLKKQRDKNRDNFMREYETDPYKIELNRGDDEVLRAILNGEDCQASTHSQQRLINARNTLKTWLRDEYEDYESNRTYATFLKTVSKVLRKHLRVLVYEVESAAEAGRMFELVNDRGRNLTALDRIKSYLVYCASQQNDEDMTRRVNRTFGNVYEELGRLSKADKHMRNFTTHHWTNFSGERGFGSYGKDDIHRRIQDPYHSPNTGEKYTDWMDAYLTSIEESAQSYATIHDPRSILESAGTDMRLRRRIVRALEHIQSLPKSGNFTRLLTASHRRFGISTEFWNIVRACEIMAFRVYGVCRAPSDTGRPMLERLGHHIEWCGVEGRDSYKRTFGGGSIDDRADPPETIKPSQRDAAQYVYNRIQEKTKEYASIEVLKEYLGQTNIVQKTEEDDRRIQSERVVRYLLYQYERYLRAGETVEDGLNSVQVIPPLSEWESDGLTNEHIYPQNADEEQQRPDLEPLKYNLGNYTPLIREDNSSAGTKTFAEKASRYADSEFQQTRTVAKENASWNPHAIHKRRDKLLSFVEDAFSFSPFKESVSQESEISAR